MAKRKNYGKSSRGYSDRKINTRETIPKFLIVCEGEKTKPNYFRKFPVPTRPKVIDVDIRGVGRTTLSLVEEALRLKEELGLKIDRDGYKDRVWCVFDRDFKQENFNAQNYNEAIIRARSQRFGVAYSNDAFELWYILHFEYYESETHRQEYKKILEARLGHRYEKNSETMYDELKDKQSIAIKYATRILEEHDSRMTGTHNPSTTVHLLVEELNKFIP
jgi:RloB-like protein